MKCLKVNTQKSNLYMVSGMIETEDKQISIAQVIPSDTESEAIGHVYMSCKKKYPEGNIDISAKLIGVLEDFPCVS